MTIEDLQFDFLDEESAKQAIEKVGTLAEENNIEWALVGGLAMSLYGCDRLTKDVDIIASQLLPVPKSQIAGRLWQGGERYLTPTDKKTMAVDWIIRRDVYCAAGH